MANEFSRPWTGLTSQGALGDAGSYSAEQWATTWRTMIGVGASYANRGVMRGVESELQVTPNSPTGLSVLVLSGSALVAGRWYYSSTTQTLSIAANASGSTRNDIIVLRADYTAQTVRLAVVQGTPAAGLPSLTQTIGTLYEIPLAYLTLASGFATVTASMITDYREYANLPDAVGYLATNSSGGTLESGAVVINTGTQSFTTTTTSYTMPMGVLERRTANGALGRVITQGIFPITCLASVSVGDYIGVGTTAGQGMAGSASMFARVLVANTGAGTKALCYVNVPGHPLAPSCKVYNNANQVFGGVATVAFNSEYYDNATMHDTVTNNSRITIPRAGIYKVSFCGTTTAAANFNLRLNGATLLGSILTTTSGGNFSFSFTDEFNFAANDYIEIINNVAVTLAYNAQYSPNFSATRISGT